MNHNKAFLITYSKNFIFNKKMLNATTKHRNIKCSEFIINRISDITKYDDKEEIHSLKYFGGEMYEIF